MKTLIAANDIQKRISELGREIAQDYANKEIVVVGVLKGAFVFMADLIRAITLPVRCDFLRVSSYENNASTGNVRIEFDLTQSIEGQHVLLVEDIVDTGRTLRFLIDHLRSKKPASIKICSLAYKEIDPTLKPMIDYLGFIVPNQYVVGYGMDADGIYRSLPDVHTFEKHPR